MPGIDPISLAAGATQFGIGALQSLLGSGKAKKAQIELERLQTPTYTPSKSILDYYNQALQRYNVNPYSSNLYKQQVQQGQRGLATALSVAREGGNTNARLSSLLQGYNDNLLKAGTAAEGLQNQKFGQLGQAAGMEAGERNKEFQYNQLLPYEKKFGLLSAKAGGANQVTNAGLSNIFGGLSSIQQMAMLDKMYGKEKTP